MEESRIEVKVYAFGRVECGICDVGLAHPHTIGEITGREGREM